MIRIALLALKNCIYSSILGPLDVFTLADRENLEMHSTPFCEVKIVTMDGNPVESFNQVSIRPHHSIERDEQYDLIFIPAMIGDVESDELFSVLETPKVVNWLLDQHRAGACLSSVCAGAFVLARTGLLNGREATTHWNMVDSFRKKYPHVRLKPEKMLIDEGDIVTAGGVTVYLDLALYLVGKLGSSELASVCSKILLIDPGRQLQTPYQISSFQKSHGDENILLVQKWLDDHFMESVNTLGLTQVSGLTERTFLRRFKKATGDSPVEYLQRLRIEAAKKKLESSRENVEEITWSVGYEDSSSFRKLFKKQTGLSPREYRNKFSLLG